MQKKHFAWIAVAAVLDGLECFVLRSQYSKHLYRSASLLFLFKPVMLTLPLQAAISTLRYQKGALNLSHVTNGPENASYMVAILTLTSYLTIWTMIGDVL